MCRQEERTQGVNEQEQDHGVGSQVTSLVQILLNPLSSDGGG